MTKTNNIVAKLAVAFVAVAMAFTLVAPSAKAQDVSSMSLEQLIALVNSLQTQLSGSGSAASCSFTFTRSLGQGSTGADVMNLQKFLNMSADTRVSVSGAGAPGMETSYYGPATAAAVSKFQTKYSADILVPSGLTSPTGYFGPSSMAKANAICKDGGSTTPGGSTGGLQGGVGDITVNETSSGVEDEVMEGEEDVEVLGFEVEAEDSDIAVTSVRVEFKHQGAGSDNFDDYAEEVSVWYDGKMVGSAEVDDFSESNDVYSRNITLKDSIVREGKEGRFHVAVTAVNNVDSDDIGEDWEGALGQIRFEDGTGAILTDTTGTGIGGTISNTFTFEDLASAGDVELTVSDDDEDVNEAHTVEVDDSSDTNGVEILSFTIEADGSDMELSQMIFDVTSSGAGVTEIANDFRLMMGGEEVGRAALDLNDDGDSVDAGEGTGFASSSDTAVAIIFTDLDDDDVMIEEGETASFTLVADINDLEGGFTNGDYLGVNLSANDVDAEDENGDDVTDLSGSASSQNISFRSEGVNLTRGTVSAVSTTVDPVGSSYGTFTMRVEVSALGGTMYIPETTARGASSTVGAAFQMEDSNGSAYTSGTTTQSWTRVSGGTMSGGYVRINSGQTATFELTVTLDPAAAGQYRLQLLTVGFNDTAATPDSTENALPASDYRTGTTNVLN